MKKEIKTNINEKIWIIQETAKELEEILKKHGEKIIPFEQLFDLQQATIETKIKFEKIANKFAKEELNILNLKKNNQEN